MPGPARDPGEASTVLDAKTLARVRAVGERLDRVAGPAGFVPFDRFMEIALYADEVGFYSQPTSPFGTAGDFYTAAHVHALFGATIARHVARVRAAIGADRPFRIVELGPGDGTLARTLLEALQRSPAKGAPLEYVLVERAPARGLAALDRALPAARECDANLRLLPSLGSDGPFSGLILASEVLDAQPARRLRWNGTVWRELGVRRSGEGFAPAEAELQEPVPAGGLPTAPEEGAVVELCPAAAGLLREAADHLVAGSLVVLDYGMEESELWRAHPRGTLSGVRGHRVVEDALRFPGASDLSVFVNFSRVRAAAQQAGLTEVAYTSQTEALAAWGFAELLAAEVGRAGSAEEEVRTRLAAKNLLFGFESFRMLELAPAATARALVTVT